MLNKVLFFFLNFHSNEIFFIQNFEKVNKKNSKKNGLIVLVPDYYHLCNIAYLTNYGEFKKISFDGIWSELFFSQLKIKNKYLECLVYIYKVIKNYFLKKKWFLLYKAVGIKKIYDLSKKDDHIKNILNILGLNYYNFFNKKETIKINDLIIDCYIRYRSEPQVDFKDKFIFTIKNRFSIISTEIKNIIKEEKPKILIMPYCNYYFGIIARIFIHSKIKTYNTMDGLSYLKELSKNNDATNTDFSKFKNVFDKLNNKKDKINISQKLLVERFSGKKQDSVFRRNFSSYKKNKYKLKKKIDGVLFLHDFFDTPNHMKNMIFSDFFEWANYTLSIISDYNLNIAVKPHPGGIWNNKKVFEYFKNKYKKIYWLNSNISNNEIINKIKFGISCYGSVLFELPYKNKVAIAGTPYHPCSNYNFTFTPKNKKDYKKLILSAKKLSCIKNSKKKVAEFYYMFAAHNHDAYENTAKKIQLKKIDFSKTASLRIFLEKLN